MTVINSRKQITSTTGLPTDVTEIIDVISDVATHYIGLPYALHALEGCMQTLESMKLIDKFVCLQTASGDIDIGFMVPSAPGVMYAMLLMIVTPAQLAALQAQHGTPGTSSGP